MTAPREPAGPALPAALEWALVQADQESRVLVEGRADAYLRSLAALRAAWPAALAELGEGAAEARALAAELRAEGLRAALGMDAAWPLPDILRVLSAAAGHLLYAHNCDHHGYERVNFAAGAAKQAEAELRRALAAAPPASDALAVLRELMAAAQRANELTVDEGHRDYRLEGAVAAVRAAYPFLRGEE